MVINDKVDNDLKRSVLCLFQAIVPEFASKYYEREREKKTKIRLNTTHMRNGFPSSTNLVLTNTTLTS